MAEYTITDPFGNESTHTTLTALEQVLAQQDNYWKAGSGESAIQLRDGERLIFFKVAEGIFIMQQPDYLVPVRHANTATPKTLTHFVGGEPFLFHKRVLIFQIHKLK